MGFGGHLIWSGVIKALEESDKRKPVICKRPHLSDLLQGRLYDGYSSLSRDPIFTNNPRVQFNAVISTHKPLLLRILDGLFLILIRPDFVIKRYERFVFGLSEKRFLKGEDRLVHVDFRIHSYAEKQTRKHMIWKTGGHAIQVIARNFKLERVKPTCEMTFLPEEERAVAELIEKEKLGSFIVFDPDTNQDWFGNLRAWSFEKWQALVERIKASHPDISLVQIGHKKSRLLSNVKDLRGLTSFREAALVIKRSKLFIGTEGGLMHAAKAVNAKAIILWGGVTLPEFAGYPNSQETVCKYVDCAPCGQLGWCDNGVKCMESIEVNEVYTKAREIFL